MTKRERNMALCVGGVVAVFGSYWVVRNIIVTPLTTARQDIAHAKREQDKLIDEKHALRRAGKEWIELTKRTFSADAEDAQLRFIARMHELLELHDLVGDPRSKDSKVTPGAINKDGNGFHTVSVSVNTAGTLKQVVGFLCDFYREPYLARIDLVNLNAGKDALDEVNSAGSSRPNRGGRRASSRSRRSRAPIGPDGPILKVDITATTLVLPKLEGLKHQVLPEEWEPLEGGRLRYVRADYNRIFEDSLFKPYQPPTPKPPPPPPPTNVAPPPVQTPRVVVTPPPPDPRRDAGNYVIRIVTSLNGQPLTYVYDESKPAEAPKVYYHDDPIDDGILMLIHRHGLVVRVNENGGDKDYFYPFGSSFADRVELRPETDPDVWAAFREEFMLGPGPDEPAPDS